MHTGLVLGLIRALPITSPWALIPHASIDLKKKKKKKEKTEKGPQRRWLHKRKKGFTK